MNKSTRFLMKVLLAIVLFTSGSIALSTAGVKIVSEAKAAVSQQQVIQYLSVRGYKVISMTQYQGGSDWSGHTILNGKDFTTHVIVSGSQIIGNEDVPFY